MLGNEFAEASDCISMKEKSLGDFDYFSFRDQELEEAATEARIEGKFLECFVGSGRGEAGVFVNLFNFFEGASLVSGGGDFVGRAMNQIA